MDSRTVGLTFNDNTPYTWFWIDLHNGPLVVEAPPRCSACQMTFGTIGPADIGFTGPDHGKGGKFLFLPPGYTGEVPEGYFVMRPRQPHTWVVWRSFLVDGSTEARRGSREEVCRRSIRSGPPGSPRRR